jgi:hypothetical protein
MNEEQEQTLLKVLIKAKREDKNLCYKDYYDCGKIRKIVAIGEGPTPKDGDEPEPGLCAYFNDGTYVALYNCDMSDFGIFEQLK